MALSVTSFTAKDGNGAPITRAVQDLAVGGGHQLASLICIVDSTGTYIMPTGDAAARPVFVQVTNGTQSLPTGDAAARKIYVTLTDGTGTAGFDNSNTTPKVSAYGKGSAAGDTAMPALDTVGHAGYVFITNGTQTMPTGDAAARKIFVQVTNGTQSLPTGDAIARSIFVEPGDGTNTFGSSSLATLQAYTATTGQIATGPGEQIATANVVTGVSAPSAALTAPGASKIFLVRTISISLAAGGTAQGPLLFTLTQDAAGTPLVLWQGCLAAPINTASQIHLTGLSIPQTVANKTLTLTSSGTVVSGTYISCTLGAAIAA